MNYWYMQMHPGDKNAIDAKGIRRIIEEYGVVGLGSSWKNKDGSENASPGTFRNVMAVGDVIAIYSSNENDTCFVALVEVVGDAYDCSINDKACWFDLARPVRILDLNAGKWKESFMRQTHGNPNEGIYFAKTLISVNHSPFIQYWHRSVQKEGAMQAYADQLIRAKQIIFTGAPGTGKTYLARQIAQMMILGKNVEDESVLSSDEAAAWKEQMGFVQFHPSFDYTDFVEGLRPVKTDDDKTIGFERRDGIFKEFCWRAAQKSDNNFDSVYERFIADISEAYSEEKPLELKTEGQGASFYVYPNARHNLNLVTGPSMQKQGSLTPDKIKSFMTDTPYKWWAGYYRGVLNYLKKHYGLSSEERKEVKPYVFIIDEINRGDISKIFGELFYAVDKGYRGVRGRVKTQYQNLIEEGEPFCEGFYVPENVYIIGTMNDIDRNVESMDFAIRRRFTWMEIKPVDRFDAMWSDVKDDLVKYRDVASQRMCSLNAAIETMDGLGKAYQIGPSYFKELSAYLEDADPFTRLWEYHLEPLLREYLRGVQDTEAAIGKLKTAYDPKKTGSELSSSEVGDAPSAGVK